MARHSLKPVGIVFPKTLEVSWPAQALIILLYGLLKSDV
jgi:hypothetical protein